MTASMFDAVERAMMACTTMLRTVSTGTSMDADASPGFRPMAES
jgi:hypothetical protein